MAGDLDEYDAGLSFGDDELWDPVAAAEPVGTVAADHGDSTAEPGAALPSRGAALPSRRAALLSRGTARPSRGQHCRARRAALPSRRAALPSRETRPPRRFLYGSSRPPLGRRRGSTGRGPRRRGRAPLAGSPPTTTRTPYRSPSSPRTGPPAPPGPGIQPRVRRPSAPRPGRPRRRSQWRRVDLVWPRDSGQDGRAAVHEDAGCATASVGITADETTQAKPGKETGPGRDEKAGPGRGKPASMPARQAGHDRGRHRAGARRGDAGRRRHRPFRRRAGEAAVHPGHPVSARPGGGCGAGGRTAGATSLLGSLTGIAAAGKTVVAVGAEPSQPAPVPLILFSADGGHTWARAAVAVPGAGTGISQGPGAGTGGSAGPGLATGPGTAGPGTTGGPDAGRGPGTAPALIAHSGGTWLALGQYAAWTSPDGKTWHPAPPLPPVAGDTVLGLAGTGTGFVAVGEHTGGHQGPWCGPHRPGGPGSAGPGERAGSPPAAGT